MPASDTSGKSIKSTQQPSKIATALNHRAFVAVTVHLEQDGAPLCLVLDVVEVAEV